MVIRPPRRSFAAEPFVTLSLSGANVSKLSRTPTGATTPVTGLTTPTFASVDSFRNHLPKHDLSPAAQKSTSPRQRKDGSLKTSPAKAVRSKIVTLKYNTPLKKVATDEGERFNPFSTPTGRDRDSAGLTLDGSVETVSVDQSRRASTSSLTDNPTRSSRRARKLTSKAQALAGTKFYASVQSASDAGSPVDHARAESESLLGEDNDVGQPGTITPTPTAIDPPVAETPVPSVETISVRSSTRERKPTARAVEIEAEKTSRKRTRSPASVERASKIARTSNSASKKLSNLRYSTAILPDTPPPDSDDTNTEIDKVRDLADTTTSENSQIMSQPTSLDDTVSVHSLTKPENQLNRAESEPKSPPPTIDQSQDDLACDLTCLSPSFRLLALAKIASEWSDPDDSDEDAEDDDTLLESTNTSTADGDLALAKMRQLYCRCALKVPGLGLAGQGDESSLQVTPVVETAKATTSKLVKATDSKVSTDTDATIRPIRTRTKARANARGSKASKTVAVLDGLDQLPLNGRQSRRSSAQTQLVTQEQSTKKPRCDSVPSADSIPSQETSMPDIVVPHEAYEELVGYQNALTLTSNSPRSDRIQVTSDGEMTETMKHEPASSESKNVKKTSGRKGKSNILKSGKNSAGGGIRLLLQNNQERDQVSYGHNSTRESPQAGSIKLRFTNGSK